MESIVIQEMSYTIPVTAADALHLKRFFINPEGPPALLVHGFFENGMIFYSRSRKGLAPYLAQAGYDVYVADLRGHGSSTPALGRHSTYGHTEAVMEDIPAFLKKIIEIRGEVPQHWIAHSWGGVVLLSHLARCGAYRHLVRSMVCFASRRLLKARTVQKWIMTDLLWKTFMYPLVAICGYAPMRVLRFGSEDETKQSYRENRRLLTSAWTDPASGFHYGNAIRQCQLPPMLHLGGKGDTYLGHISDIQRLIAEIGAAHAEHWILGASQGSLHDYDHVNILTHPDAVRDHFPKIIDWLKGRYCIQGKVFPSEE